MFGQLLHSESMTTRKMEPFKFCKINTASSIHYCDVAQVIAIPPGTVSKATNDKALK